MLQTGGQRHLFAEVPGQIKSLDVSVPLCVAADLLPCVVGAAIVDAQDFVIAGEFLKNRNDRLEENRCHLRLVVHGRNYGHGAFLVNS